MHREMISATAKKWLLQSPFFFFSLSLSIPWQSLQQAFLEVTSWPFVKLLSIQINLINCSRLFIYTHLAWSSKHGKSQHVEGINRRFSGFSSAPSCLQHYNHFSFFFFKISNAILNYLVKTIDFLVRSIVVYHYFSKHSKLLFSICTAFPESLSLIHL